MSVLHNKAWTELLGSCGHWVLVLESAVLGCAGLSWAGLGWAAIPDNEGKNRAQAQAEDNG